MFLLHKCTDNSKPFQTIADHFKPCEATPTHCKAFQNKLEQLQTTSMPFKIPQSIPNHIMPPQTVANISRYLRTLKTTNATPSKHFAMTKQDSIDD